MQTYRGRETTQSGLVFVVVIHVLVIYAMWTGLTRTVIDRIRPPMDAVTIVDPKPPEPERQPLPSTRMVNAPQVVVRMQDIEIATLPDAPRITLPATSEPGPARAADSGRSSEDGTMARAGPGSKGVQTRIPLRARLSAAGAA